MHAVRRRQSDEPRGAPALGHGDAGVGEHEARYEFGVLCRDAHGDRPTPVLRNDPYRAL